MSTWFGNHEKDSVDDSLARPSQNELEALVNSWVSPQKAGHALDSREGDDCSREATQRPPVADFHRSLPSASRPQDLYDVCKVDWGDVGSLDLIFVIWRCGLHIHALPGSPTSLGSEGNGDE